MKAKTKEVEQEFKPVTIEITFENEEEMKDFKSVFNYIPVCDIFERLDIDSHVIGDAIPCGRHTNVNWDGFVSRVKGESND